MKVVKFAGRFAVILESGAQVLYERDKPIALRTPAGVWYQNQNVSDNTFIYIEKYLRHAKASGAVAYPEHQFMFMVERL